MSATSALTKEQIIELIRPVNDPEIGRGLVELNMIPEVVIDGRDVTLHIELPTPVSPHRAQIEQELRADLPAIGPETVAKAWAQRDARGLAPFFAVGDARSISAVWDGPTIRISQPDEAIAQFAGALPVIEVEDAGDIVPGYSVGFTHPGQTEFIAERCGVAADNVAMMLAGPTLRTVPVTTHVPLRDVFDLLTVDLVLAKVRTTERGPVRNFGIAAPRLVLAGLNPHAASRARWAARRSKSCSPRSSRRAPRGSMWSGRWRRIRCSIRARANATRR